MASESSGSRHLNRLHAGLASGADLGDQFANALGVGEALRLFHEKPGKGNAAARTEVARRLVADAEANHAAGADNVFAALGVVGGLVCVVVELGLEGADFILQLDDIVAVNLAAFGGVEVFADGAGALAGQAARQGRVATSFALARWSVGMVGVAVDVLTCRQRQQAVKV